MLGLSELLSFPYMRKTLLACTAGLLLGGSYLRISGAQRPGSAALPAGSSEQLLVKQYCVTCHNEKARTADLSLENLDITHPENNPAIWEKVLHKLRTREMPPPRAPRPDNAAYDGLVTYVETALDREAEARPNPGRPGAYRLNRSQYANAVRDLISLDVDAASLLPPDDSGYGFDNIGDVLTVSPVLLEKYLSAAAKISRIAIGDPALSPTSTDYEIPPATVQSERENSELPIGSRGGVALHHYFPVDAEYVIKVRLQRGKDATTILGVSEERQLDVRIDGARVKLFTFGGPNKADLAENADDRLEVRVPVKAGPHIIAATFLKDTVKAEGVMDNAGNQAFFEGVGSVSILGPYGVKSSGDSPSRRRIFMCRPTGRQDEEACATKIITSLARRAYRRPIHPEELPALLIPYNTARDTGTFDDGIRLALQRILVSPDFLFRIEVDPAETARGAAYRVSDIELASRLSFFLWSSIPDEELLSVAERGQLRDAPVLDQQVKRMLADPRANTLVTNFIGQWLYLRNIETVLPDPTAFPDFDENLRAALAKETELFFQSMLHEDRSLLDLLRADYTFLNERLARHYGIPGIRGSEFRRVNLSQEERKGLLGQGSVLAVTSYPNRTSPTLRGKWLLETLLGSAPPPPPANVPSLKEDKDVSTLSMRQRLQLHQASPSCSSCHSRMDPLGFALEGFDGLGRWRNGIDSSGVLPDGTRVDGPVDLRNILLSKKDEFVMTATERMLTYGLGRGVEPFDMPAVRKIAREAARNDYRWSSLIMGVVKSTPFQMRRAR
jgi:mono/diheme cytochrome c family protein